MGSGEAKDALALSATTQIPATKSFGLMVVTSPASFRTIR
jgi:hypothetical protein